MLEEPVHPLARLPFPQSPDEWRDSPAVWGAERLEIMGHPVMERWETPYMAELARRACSRGGRVLEVGFGLGIAAGFIQQHAIAEHWIIEANRAVFGTIASWAARASAPVTPLLGFWEDIAPQLPGASFDGILFDPYPIDAEQLRDQRFSFFAQALRLLRPGGVFTHYSGETALTEDYQRRLSGAGFAGYDTSIVAVSPPPGCLYWQEPRMLALSACKSG